MLGICGRRASNSLFAGIEDEILQPPCQWQWRRLRGPSNSGPKCLKLFTVLIGEPWSSVRVSELRSRKDERVGWKRKESHQREGHSRTAHRRRAEQE